MARHSPVYQFYNGFWFLHFYIFTILKITNQKTNIKTKILKQQTTTKTTTKRHSFFKILFFLGSTHLNTRFSRWGSTSCILATARTQKSWPILDVISVETENEKDQNCPDTAKEWDILPTRKTIGNVRTTTTFACSVNMVVTALQFVRIQTLPVCVQTLYPFSRTVRIFVLVGCHSETENHDTDMKVRTRYEHERYVVNQTLCFHVVVTPRSARQILSTLRKSIVTLVCTVFEYVWCLRVSCDYSRRRTEQSRDHERMSMWPIRFCRSWNSMEEVRNNQTYRQMRVRSYR